MGWLGHLGLCVEWGEGGEPLGDTVLQPGRKWCDGPGERSARLGHSQEPGLRRISRWRMRCAHATEG